MSHEDNMAGRGSIDRLSQVLDLFDDAQGLVSVDTIASALSLTRSTTYRTVQALVEIGMLDRVSDEGFSLGPRIMELYRHLQLGSPLLSAARPVMIALASEAAKGTAVLLCRAYRDRVMCMHQEMTYGPQEPVSYQVGRPMPLYSGASSITVLAALDRKRLNQLYARDQSQIGQAGLGATADEFIMRLKAIRKIGHHVSRGEVDRGRIGVAASFVEPGQRIIGSVSLVLSQDQASDLDVSRARVQVVAGAHDIAARLAAMRVARARQELPARVRNGA
jgi:DNA-binding IclR family transcriptional regulator